LIDIDYKYFTVEKIRSPEKKITKKELFLTYSGLLRVLFVSRSGTAHKFINWATKSLFTLQFGTHDQKTELVADAMGVDAKLVKQVFNKSCTTTPGIYMFTLGTVKDLRKSMKIGKEYKDDAIVAKYGMTVDLPRRTGEHIKTYNKIKNVDLKLKYHSYIDPQYISSAECDLKNFFDALSLDFSFEKYDELIIIPKKHDKLVKKQYEHLSKSYMGNIADLVNKLKDKDHELLLAKNNDNLSIKEYENKLLKKDNELLQMQNELNILKLKLKKYKNFKK
jgi:hypothetical protein